MTEIQSNQPTAIPATEHGMVIVVIERDSYRNPPDLFPWWARLGFGVVVVVALVAIAVLAGPMVAGVCAPVMVVLAGVVFRGAPPEPEETTEVWRVDSSAITDFRRSDPS